MEPILWFENTRRLMFGKYEGDIGIILNTVEEIMEEVMVVVTEIYMVSV